MQAIRGIYETFCITRFGQITFQDPEAEAADGNVNSRKYWTNCPGYDKNNVLSCQSNVVLIVRGGHLSPVILRQDSSV